MGESKASHGFVYFLAGLGIGAIAALIFAPGSGEETRRYVAAKAEEGKDYLAGKGKEVRRQAGEFIVKGKELMSKGRERFGGAVQVGRQSYRSSMGR